MPVVRNYVSCLSFDTVQPFVWNIARSSEVFSEELYFNNIKLILITYTHIPTPCDYKIKKPILI